MRRTSLSSAGTFGALSDSENIKVYLRVRPFVDREDNTVNDSKPSSIIQILEDSSADQLEDCHPYATTTVKVGDNRFAPYGVEGGELFTFDAVGVEETKQETVFEQVVKPIADNCLLGYNGTIFAYGQTGSGKTFTMQGPTNEDGSIDYEQRGVIPRTFDYIFQRMREEEKRSNGAVAFIYKCAYVEIYNEFVYDLLDASASTCNLREDSKKGVYVEGCREEIVHDSHDAFMLYEEGSRNRHVAETAMNRESSRSHCVFTITLQSKKLDGAIVDVREARFNLVDLAGSERQQMTATVGARLKEAGNINKSLLALSNVINALVDIANGKSRHVHYRDSKLTFLLRDSLGGNAKTLIIAAVSPSPLCQAETLSTLRFAQRAKQIRNKAIVNKDIQGNIFELQAEVRRLRHENLLLKTASAPAAGAVNEFVDDTTMEDENLIWTVNYQRIKDMQQEIDRLSKFLESSQAVIQRREEQLKSEKMIAKFRETSIQTYENELVKKLQRDASEDSLNLLEVFKQERARFKNEIFELKRLVENHPDVTRYAHELLELKGKLAKCDLRKMTEYEGQIEKLHQYADELWKKLSQFEQESIKLRKTAAMEIPTQEMRTSIESLSTMMLNKSGDDLSGKLQRTMQGKQVMEERYDMLLQETELLRAELEERKRGRMDAAIECVIDFDELILSDKKRRIFGGSRDSLALEEKIGRLEDENHCLQSNLSSLQEEVAKEAQASQALASDLCTVQLQYKERLGLTERELSLAMEKLEGALADRNCLDSERAALAGNVADLRNALEEAEGQYRNATGVLQETKGELDNNQQLISTLERQIEHLTAQLGQYEPLKSFGSSGEEIARRIEEGHQQQALLEQKIVKLEFGLLAAQQDNEELLYKVQTLTAAASVERLAQAEAIIASLHVELDDVREELVKLRQENDKLIQHRNIKQKLQYHVAIKEENNVFREEIRQLRDELTRLRQRNIELEETVKSFSS